MYDIDNISQTLGKDFNIKITFKKYFYELR